MSGAPVVSLLAERLRRLPKTGSPVIEDPVVVELVRREHALLLWEFHVADALAIAGPQAERERP